MPGSTRSPRSVEAVGSSTRTAFPRPGFFEAALGRLRGDPGVGGVAGRLVRPGGEVLDSCGQVLTPWLLRVRDRGYGRPAAGAFVEPAVVLAACGAGMVYRRAALQAVAVRGRVFPDEFFAFWEDLELGWRVSAAGWRVVYEPSAVAVHRRGGTAAPGSGRLVFRRPPAVAAGILVNRWATWLRNLTAVDFWRRLPVLLPADAVMVLLVALRRPAVLPAVVRALPRLSGGVAPATGGAAAALEGAAVSALLLAPGLRAGGAAGALLHAGGAAGGAALRHRRQAGRAAQDPGGAGAVPRGPRDLPRLPGGARPGAAVRQPAARAAAGRHADAPGRAHRRLRRADAARQGGRAGGGDLRAGALRGGHRAGGGARGAALAARRRVAAGGVQRVQPARHHGRPGGRGGLSGGTRDGRRGAGGRGVPGGRRGIRPGRRAARLPGLQLPSGPHLHGRCRQPGDRHLPRRPGARHPLDRPQPGRVPGAPGDPRRAAGRHGLRERAAGPGGSAVLARQPRPFPAAPAARPRRCGAAGGAGLLRPGAGGRGDRRGERAVVVVAAGACGCWAASGSGCSRCWAG